jgi:glycosyltransferase involved in cell wall biosynthesis
VQANLVHADFLSAITKLLFFPRFKLLSVKHGYHPRYQDKFGFNLEYIKFDPFYWLQKFSSYFIDYNITVSKGLLRVYSDGRIISKSKIRNVYYGLSIDSEKLGNTKTDVPQSPYVLILGRLVGMKGHRYLLSAWKKVQEQVPELKLYIAGDGELFEDISMKIKKYGLTDSVHILGHISNPHPLIMNSKFTIVTSTWEGFGLIMLESWIHKKAIVAFDVPAMNEVIDDNHNGLLVPFKNTDVLAEKIIWLYNNNDKSIEMGENGYNKLKTYYTLQRKTEEMESVYNQLLLDL